VGWRPCNRHLLLGVRLRRDPPDCDAAWITAPERGETPTFERGLEAMIEEDAARLACELMRAACASRVAGSAGRRAAPRQLGVRSAPARFALGELRPRLGRRDGCKDEAKPTGADSSP
jgi:hypothetical protein